MNVCRRQTSAILDPMFETKLSFLVLTLSKSPQRKTHPNVHLLNVLRFGGAEGKRVLSEHGIEIINEAAELCYLTQVVFRLFEDTRRSMTDAKRFRVEILFSPGATATPMHMAELDREKDSTRFDTSPLKLIGRDGLTCRDIEEYFTSAIQAGQADHDALSLSTHNALTNNPVPQNRPPLPTSVTSDAPTPKMSSLKPAMPVEVLDGGLPLLDLDDPIISLPLLDLGDPTISLEVPTLEPRTPDSNIPTIIEGEGLVANNMKAKDVLDPSSLEAEHDLTESEEEAVLATVARSHEESKSPAGKDATDRSPTMIDSTSDPNAKTDDDVSDEDDERVERLARILARKYFWRSMAVFSFVLGAGCLVLSMNVRDSARQQRRWTRR